MLIRGGAFSNICMSPIQGNYIHGFKIQKSIKLFFEFRIFLLSLFMQYGVATIFKACPIGYLDGM